MGYAYFSPDKSYYSVPYRYIGKHTLIHYTNRAVEIYYNHNRIAVHMRNPCKGSYNTIKDHLSSTHKFYTDWSPEFFKNMGAKHGEHVVKCVESILSKNDYPETGYKRVMGLIQLHKAYGSNRLDNACKRALQTDSPSYMRVKTILKNNMDKTSLFYGELETEESIQQDQTHIPDHKNIRGASAYQ